MALRIYLALILVFVAAAGTRLAFLHFAASGTFSNPDTAGYQGLADSLSSDWTYATDKAAGAPGGFPAPSRLSTLPEFDQPVVRGE
jgi:hypothetical protein